MLVRHLGHKVHAEKHRHSQTDSQMDKMVMAMCVCVFVRHHGCEVHDGEAGAGEDSLGAEENDCRGGHHQLRCHQLQGLCHDDARQKFRCLEKVSQLLR